MDCTGFALAGFTLSFTITWEFVTFTAAQEDRLGLFFREGRLFLVVVEGS
jgi:hypothetical protein